MNRKEIIKVFMDADGHMNDFSGGIEISWDNLVKGATQLIEAEREKVAQWMMQRGYATGHGDTTEDLLVELDWQIAENWTRAMVNGVETEREECAKIVDKWFEGMSSEPEMKEIAAEIRARGKG